MTQNQDRRATVRTLALSVTIACAAPWAAVGADLPPLPLLLAQATPPSTPPGAPASGLTASQLKVRKASSIQFQNTVIAFGGVAQLKATIKDPASTFPIQFGKVEYKVNGQVVGTATSTGAGLARFDYKVDGNVPLGTMNIEAHFLGNDDYQPVKDTGTLGVIKSSSAIANYYVQPGCQIQALRAGCTMTVTGQLQRESDDGALSGRPMKLMIGANAAKSATTDAMGKFKLELTAADTAGFVGPITLLSQYEGEATYLSTAKSSTYTFLPPLKVGHAVVLSPGGPYEVGASTTLEAILGETKVGTSVVNGIPNVKLLLTATSQYGWQEGMAWTATTDATGHAKFNVKFDRVFTGRLSVRPEFGQAWTADDSEGISWPLAVVRGKIKLEVQMAATAKQGDPVPVMVTVRRNADNATVAGLKVSNQNAASTNAAGQTGFQVTFPQPGTHSLPIAIEESENYEKAALTKTIVITPK